MKIRREERETASLHADPANAALFDALSADELQDLATSIGEYGLINDIWVTEDGLIIAGEQRWRAAQLAGVERVPVKVTEVKDARQIVRLRIEENIRRRNLSTMDRARSIAKLYELAGFRRERPKRTEEHEQSNTYYPVSGEATDEQPATREEIAKSIGVSPQQVSRYYTLSHLIPELAALVDERKLGVNLAYKYAQLPEEDQKQIAQSYDAVVLESKQLRANVEELSKEILRLADQRDREVRQLEEDWEVDRKRLARELGEDAVQERLAQKDAEVAAVRKKAAEEMEKAAENVARIQQGAAEQIEMLTRQREDAREFTRTDPVCRLMELANAVTDLRVEVRVQKMTSSEFVRQEARHHLRVIAAIVPWLAEYEHQLRVVLDEPAAELEPVSLKEGRKKKAFQKIGAQGSDNDHRAD